MDYNNTWARCVGIVLAFAATSLYSGTAAHEHASHGDHTSTSSGNSAGYGVPGKATQVSRTVALEASDRMRFSPADIRVRRGETIRFVITNAGKLAHEFTLGTRQELQAHADMMKKFPDMVHEEANKVTLAPGQQGEVVWKFTQAGVVDFACLKPGHLEAGMKGQVLVAGAN